jgi:G3E family GTPase
MIGGFLGAGKTTSVARLADQLTGRGLRVGLITNDQGRELVDTAMLRSRGFATQEIPGGCFCCRFDSLLDAANRLTSESRPEVFIAEPVGSCTDLVATVTYPLRRLYGERFTIAPLSVLVDPVRAGRVLGLTHGSSFSPKVLYIYRKQLEEANLIVVNKTDLLDPESLNKLITALQVEFPRAEVLSVSARTGAGLDEWFARLMATQQAAGNTMNVDYDIYAEGEALLGWFNSTVQLSSGPPFDGNRVLHLLAHDLKTRMAELGGEIAHLKMTLTPERGLGDIAVINLVRNDFVPELSQELPGTLQRGQLILNLRAEADPGQIESAVQAGLQSLKAQISDLAFRIEHLEHFRPGKPQPTHRMAALSE